MLPYRSGGIPDLIVNNEGGLLLGKLTRYILHEVLLTIILDTQLSLTGGGVKVYPFPGTGGQTEQAIHLDTTKFHVDSKLISI